MGIEHSTAKSFLYAFEGVKTAFKEEPNFKIHTAIAIFAIILALLLKFSPSEWAILLITICLVLILELVNTALESIVNLVSPQVKQEAKIAKDVAASAVLLVSVTSFLIGIILFVPKILSILTF